MEAQLNGQMEGQMDGPALRRLRTEYAKLTQELIFTEQLVPRSKILQKLQEQLQGNTEIQSNFLRVRGPHAGVKVVVYQPGSIQYSWAAKFRFTIVFFLTKIYANLFGDVEICDPNLNVVEQRVIRNLTWHVNLTHEVGRKVDAPTLFVVPHPDRNLFDGLVELNAPPGDLNQIIILGASFKNMVETATKVLDSAARYADVSDQRLKMRRLTQIQPHLVELEICNELNDILQGDLLDGGGSSNGEGVLEDILGTHDPNYGILSWHFFNVNQDVSSSISLGGNLNLTEGASSSRVAASGNLVEGGAHNEEANDIAVLRLKEEIETTMEELRESEIYMRFSGRLKNDPDVLGNVTRVLGTHTHIDMVIYGVGSIECYYVPQYQLALALLLKEDSCLPIGEIEVYDPAMNATETKVLADLGCKMILNNEQCRRKINKPTLFFVPGLFVWLLANIFEVNFHEEKLNQIIVVDYQGRSARSFKGKVWYWNNALVLQMSNYSEERERFLWAARHYQTSEIRMDPVNCFSSIISQLKLNFFHIDTRVNMESMLPTVSGKQRFFADCLFDRQHNYAFLHDDQNQWKAMVEETYAKCFGGEAHAPQYAPLVFAENRAPERYRWFWQPPQQGWIKLNFAGYIGEGEGAAAGHGGTFHDENGRLLLSYAGPARNAPDLTAADVEALRQGLRCLKKLPPIPKLMIEGDALKVVHWVNRAFPPPQRFNREIREILRLMSCVNFSATIHIYKEANHKAAQLAQRGAARRRLRKWAN